MLVLEACGKWGSSRWTTNMTRTLRDKADPSSKASKTSRSTSSCIAGPRNWQPRARTAAHRLADSCCGFWCWRMSSVTVRSPKERAARTALARPSDSASWQVTKVTNLRCMGRERRGTPPLIFRKRASSSTQRLLERYNCHCSLSNEDNKVVVDWTSSSMHWSSSWSSSWWSPWSPLFWIPGGEINCNRAVLTGKSSASMLTLLWSNGHCRRCSFERHVYIHQETVVIKFELDYCLKWTYLAERVSACEADGLTLDAVKFVSADRTRKKFSPLRSLYGHSLKYLPLLPYCL